MSNIGQAALIVVGTVVGAYFGGPAGAQLGFALGGLAGSALFPTQLPSGPRITDNRTTTATIGLPVPLLFGTADLAGTIIWLAPLIEHSSEQGGKGGPHQKVFNYTQSIAIGLCERVDDFAPATEPAIGGITRIWENGTLVYDIRPQQHANTALGLLAETDAEYSRRLSISAQYAETFTLYLGDETQEPDTTIEGVEGMGNVPGFRGLAYIVYPNRQLQQGQGLRHPNFTFECYQNGTGHCTFDPLSSNEVLYPWHGGVSQNPVNDLNSNAFTVVSVDTAVGHGADGNTYANESDLLAALNTSYSHSVVPVGYYGGGTAELTQAGGAQVTSVQGGTPDPSQVQVYYNIELPTSGYYTDAQRIAQTIPVHDTSLALWHAGGSLWFNTGIPYTTTYAPVAPWVRTDVQDLYGTTTQWNYFQMESADVTVVRSPSAPMDLCAGLMPDPAHSGYAFQADGTIIQCNPWVYTTGSSFKVLQAYVSGTPCTYPLNPCLPSTDPNYSNATFWTAAYNAAVLAGTMVAGKIYGTNYPVTQTFAWTVDRVICEGAGAAATIADIIAAICKRAGLSSSQLDVSDLTAITVSGYSISGICSAETIISPLRSVGFFDCVESGSVLRFPTRGKEIVMQLTEDQFGCFDGDLFGSPDSIPPKMQVARADETTLPRSIRLHYKAVSRDYQDGEQNSPFRLTTKAVDDQDISIPLCIGDTQALQAAEIIWSDAWAGQNSYQLAIDQSLLELEGGDCIGVPVDGVIQRMRIVSDSNASGVLRKLQCVFDSQGSYISFAEAQAPQVTAQKLSLISPSRAYFLNIPALSDQDNNAGFYVVAYPDPAAGGNVWQGAQFYQSVDSVNFTQSVQALSAATVGTIDTPIPVSEAFDFDDYTTITVNCDKSQSFVSRTDDAVLAGANAAAMGADGRWEIVQFANAEQITATQWQLSRLLRGRRGTEHVMGSSQAGDTFVMVSTGDAVRVPLSVSQIGATYDYKVVSFGAAFATGNDYTFISRGTALIPFAPVDALAAFQSGGDIEISWTRRDRLGQTLMSGMDIPLSDYPESFQVDIVELPHSPSSPTTIYRTLTTGTTSVRYTAADFAADYGAASPSNTIAVRIYQMSLTMGRGIPLESEVAVT